MKIKKSPDTLRLPVTILAIGVSLCVGANIWEQYAHAARYVSVSRGLTTVFRPRSESSYNVTILRIIPRGGGSISKLPIPQDALIVSDNSGPLAQESSDLEYGTSRVHLYGGNRFLLGLNLDKIPLNTDHIDFMLDPAPYNRLPSGYFLLSFLLISISFVWLFINIFIETFFKPKPKSD